MKLKINSYVRQDLKDIYVEGKVLGGRFLFPSFKEFRTFLKIAISANSGYSGQVESYLEAHDGIPSLEDLIISVNELLEMEEDYTEGQANLRECGAQIRSTQLVVATPLKSA